MMNKYWRRLTGWLTALVMLLTVLPTVTFAETEGKLDEELPSVNTVDAPPMQQIFTEADITEYDISYKDASGKTVAVEAMDPNKENWMTLKISGLNKNMQLRRKP
jgi:hypothetical protein